MLEVKQSNGTLIGLMWEWLATPKPITIPLVFFVFIFFSRQSSTLLQK